MLLTFIKSENCTFTADRHNYKDVVHSIKFTCPDRLNCSFPGACAVIWFDVLSVCVFVIREIFVRKKKEEKKKKERKKKKKKEPTCA